MEITEKNENNISIVSLSGRLDASSAPEAEQQLNQTLDSNKKLVINLTDLEYISSAGLRVLLVAAKKIRHNSGNMALCGLQESVQEVFDISGFSSIFSIHSDEAAATGSLQ